MDFTYALHRELIAPTPAEPRDHSRLLIYDRKTEEITDDRFYNIGRYLPENTTLVVNNSRVEKCRLLFDGGRKEIFVAKVHSDNIVEAMVRPGKMFREGKKGRLTADLSADTLTIAPDGLRTLQMSTAQDDYILYHYRHTPFPPYIERDESLPERYQTVFAAEEGSKAE